MLPLYIDPGTMSFSRSLREHAVAASEAGFDGVEIPLMRALELGPAPTFRRFVEALGLGTAMFSCPWQLPADASVSAELFEARLRRLPELCEFAQAAGGAKLSVMFRGGAPPDLPALGLAQLAERIDRMSEVTSRHGLQLCVELNDADHLRRAAELLGLIGRPYSECGVLVDVYHLHRCDLGTPWINGLPAGSIGWVHISDAPASLLQSRPRDGSRALPGAGVLPLVDWLRRCIELGADTLSVEVLDPELARRPAVEIARLCRQSAASVLSQLDAGGR